MKLMTVYAINNSLKFSLFDMNDESILSRGIFERVGMENSRFIIQFNQEQIVEELEINNFLEAVHILLDKMVALNIIRSFEDIDAIGHKILFGGEAFPESVFISNDVITQLEEYASICPMKSSVEVISAFSSVFPNVDMIAIFDTSFYHSLPEESYLYGVPYSWYHDYGVRKYGFQGIHHQFITNEVHSLLGRDNLKIISCYLDSESSVSAILNDKCIDTSMGFSTFSGLLMGTKSGDIDPSIIPYVMEKEGKNVGEVLEVLKHFSGLLGLSECSGDMRDIMALCDEEHPKVVIAKNKYVRKIVDYISQYYVLLDGCDVLVFSGSIGENNGEIRKEICERLKCLGVRIDSNQNLSNPIISSNDSPIVVCVIPDNEELMMVREIMKLMNR